MICLRRRVSDFVRVAGRVSGDPDSPEEGTGLRPTCSMLFQYSPLFLSRTALRRPRFAGL